MRREKKAIIHLNFPSWKMIWRMPHSAETHRQNQSDPSCCSSPSPPAGFLELPHPRSSPQALGMPGGMLRSLLPEEPSPGGYSLFLAQNEVRLCTRLTRNKCSHELAERDIVQPNSRPRAAGPGRGRRCRCVFLENGRPYGKYWKKPSDIYIPKCFFS